MRAAVSKHFFILGVVFTCLMSTRQAYASSVGVAGGVDLPFARDRTTDVGPAAEVFFRADPYEIRFHYSSIKTDTYSITANYKYFFTDALLRPYVEGGAGPLITHTQQRGVAYGVKPEVTLGADLGLSSKFAVGVQARYFVLAYFGSTRNGKFETNHGLTMVGSFSVWF